MGVRVHEKIRDIIRVKPVSESTETYFNFQLRREPT